MCTVGHAIVDTADVKTFLLGNNILLISPDKYFETIFLRGEVLHGILMYLLRERGNFRTWIFHKVM